VTAPHAKSRRPHTTITLKQGEIDVPLETEYSRWVRTHVSRMGETVGPPGGTQFRPTADLYPVSNPAERAALPEVFGCARTT
jgi:hypothetical protein